MAQRQGEQQRGAVRNWSGIGHRADPLALWGLWQGSGANPYQTVVDLAGPGSGPGGGEGRGARPASKCSCPSRKFPCKHAVALQSLWSSGLLPEAEPPDFAADWLAKRAGGRPAGSTAEAVRSEGPADPKAAAKRVADRAARVTAGLDELDQWLCDQLRTGLAGLDRGGYQQLEAIAARMVDAQAPGVAGRLRRLVGVLASGEGWHARVLEELALLRLLVRAHRRLGELSAPLAAAVRAQVGYPVTRAEVLARPGVRDTWSVLGQRDQLEERLASRRIWLQGAGSGRIALLLSYVPVGRSFDDSLSPGTSVDADLHFYPGGRRALVGAQHGEPGPLAEPKTVGIAQALDGYCTALTADPWTASWPVVLDAVAPVHHDGRWLLREAGGVALPLAPARGSGSAEAPWVLLACSGGEPVTVLGEWAPGGFSALSVIRRRELVRL